MTEQLEIFDLKGKSLGTQDRKQFYSEIKKEYAKKGSISRQVKSIRLILMNSKGRIYLQKRSKFKTQNSGLYDKTIGGHVSYSESFNLATVRECAEELGFPASILSSEDFDRAIKDTDLSIVGIFKKIDVINNFESVRTIKGGSRLVQPYITSIYIGYYDGAIRFVDGESTGIEVFTLKELKEELKNNPEKFTEDINVMVKKYEKYLVPVKSI